MKYEEKYTINSFDVDENNNIRPTNLINYLQETADHHMRDRKPSYYDFFYEGKAFVVIRMSVEIYKQIHGYDKVKVRTWVLPAKGATFPRCYEILRKGQVIAAAYSEWAVGNRHTGKLCRADEVNVGNYDMDEPIELSIPKRFRFPKDMEFQHLGERHVFYSDCDMNGHMNNANYYNMLWNYIPDIGQKEVTSINIRFNHEAFLGRDIGIQMCRDAGKTSVDGKGEEYYGFKTDIEDKRNIECVIGVRTIKKNYTYMLRCADDSLYTGWTNDIEKRVESHNNGKGAKYTRNRSPVELVYLEAFDDRETAMSIEAKIKRLSKQEKEEMIESNRNLMKK